MPHHVEDRTVGVVGGGETTGGDRRPGLVLQIGSIDGHQVPEAAQVEQGAVIRDVVVREFEFTDEQVEQLRADVVGHLETDRLVEAASPQFGLDGFEQVVGLVLLEVDVGVATHPERSPLLDDHPDEERVEFGGDQFLDGEEPPDGDLDEAWEHVRDLQSSESAVPGVGIGDVDRQRQREVGDVRERMAGIDGEGRQHRVHALLVPLVERGDLLVVEVGIVDDRNAGLGQGRDRTRRRTPCRAARRNPGRGR